MSHRRIEIPFPFFLPLFFFSRHGKGGDFFFFCRYVFSGSQLDSENGRNGKAVSLPFFRRRTWNLLLFFFLPFARMINTQPALRPPSPFFYSFPELIELSWRLTQELIFAPTRRNTRYPFLLTVPPRQEAAALQRSCPPPSFPLICGLALVVKMKRGLFFLAPRGPSSFFPFPPITDITSVGCFFFFFPSEDTPPPPPMK